MPTSSAAPAILPIAAVSQLAFRDAMSGLAAAVNVITTDGPGGRAGFTATAVCSVQRDGSTADAAGVYQPQCIGV